VTDVVGVILAGGLARRLGGGDKCLIELAGRPLLSWIIERVTPQVPHLILNANGDAARFARFGLPVVADTVPNFAGPLAGILSALEWTKAHAPSIRWVASFAGDAPFVPSDIVTRFLEAQRANDAELVGAASGGQTNPVCGLWCVDLADDLRRALVEEDLHKIDAWTARYKFALVEFGVEPVDPFFNINRPEDHAKAEALARSHSGTRA
jgi:molybdopterin-guanine dinucleotide biosynthesis protein A